MRYELYGFTDEELANLVPGQAIAVVVQRFEVTKDGGILIKLAKMPPVESSPNTLVDVLSEASVGLVIADRIAELTEAIKDIKQIGSNHVYRFSQET